MRSPETGSADLGSCLLVHPELITSTGQLNGAAFLYFSEPVLLPYPPAPAISRIEVLGKIVEHLCRTPDSTLAAPLLVHIVQWFGNTLSFYRVTDVLEPLRDSGRLLVRIPPAHLEEMSAQADRMLKTSGLEINDIDVSGSPMAEAALVEYLIEKAYLDCGGDVQALLDLAEPITH